MEKKKKDSLAVAVIFTKFNQISFLHNSSDRLRQDFAAIF